ncbi:hypothetical protein [Deinococcus puniceus]|uniref:hypothetical protein n=1 Tax=Deinococcus puniceus TaxID=1182568 RepID=UPI0007C8FA20|nr:hypothetical protein [Deinococcus puniceus]
MTLFRGLILCASFCLASAGGQGSPPLPSTPLQQSGSSQGSSSQNFDEQNAAIARLAPAFGGYYTQDKLLYIVTTLDDEAARQTAVETLFAQQGEQLRRNGFSPQQVRFVRGQFNAAQLLQAKEVVQGVRGWTGLGIDQKLNRVDVRLALPVLEADAQAFVARRLPAGIVVFTSRPPQTLPPADTLPHPHRAVLNVELKDKAVQIRLDLTNTGRERLQFSHGACDFSFEVVRLETGEVVRPSPAVDLCGLVGHLIDLKPGATLTLASGTWNVRTPEGQAAPQGRYLIRAAFELFQSDGNEATNHVIRPADVVLELPVKVN